MNDPASTSLTITHHFMGFGQEAVDRLGRISSELIKAASGYLDVNDLEGITFAADYQEGLASVDRGYEADPITYTVVLGPIVCDLLLSEDEVERQKGWRIFIHELAHVDDNSMLMRSFTAVDDDRIKADAKAAFLFEIAGDTWSEYYCSRVTAPIGEADSTADAELFAGTCKTQLPALRAAKTDYRFDGDLNALVLTAKRVISHVLDAFVSLAGHCDGTGEERAIEEALRTAEIDDETRAALQELAVKLRSLWRDRGSWSLDDFVSLNSPVEQIFRAHGMLLGIAADGSLYADVPISPAEEAYLMILRAAGR